jgi:periplasmic protein CpxP/Spy
VFHVSSVTLSTVDDDWNEGPGTSAGPEETTMMRRTLAAMVGAVAVAAVVTTGYVQAQAPDGATPPARHERRGPGGPGGPGGFVGRGGPGGPGGPGGFGGVMRLLRQLDLTDDQRAQVRQVMDSHRDALKAIGDRLQAAHRAQNDAVTAAQFDEQLVRAKAADLAAVMADAAVLHAKVHGEVFAVLTPEQQAKAAELKAQFQARAEQFRKQVRERVKERRQRATPAQ